MGWDWRTAAATADKSLGGSGVSKFPEPALLLIISGNSYSALRLVIDGLGGLLLSSG
jgi:hypothetical protein